MDTMEKGYSMSRQDYGSGTGGYKVNVTQRAQSLFNPGCVNLQ